MQLTDQMKAEIDGMRKYLDRMEPMRTFIRKESFTGILTPNTQIYIAENAEKLSTYKVRLENLLCETDSKGRDH